MAGKTLKIMVAISLAALAFGISVVILCVVMLLMRPTHDLSTATSPDGSWGMNVVAKPVIPGGYEVVAIPTNGAGKPLQRHAFVIGRTEDPAQAKKDYRVVFKNNERAIIGNDRVFERSKFFQ